MGLRTSTQLKMTLTSGGPKTASKKKRKGKKKASTPNDGSAKAGDTNGLKPEQEDESEQDNVASSPMVSLGVNRFTAGHPILNGVSYKQKTASSDHPHSTASTPVSQNPTTEKDLPIRNGTSSGPRTQSSSQGPDDEAVDANSSEAGGLPGDAASQLNLLQQEREALRKEVTQLRQSIESLQDQHNEELTGVKEELEQTQQDKEEAESQFSNLRDKVNTIRSQLGERLKADAEELERARGTIEGLESEKQTATAQTEQLRESVTRLNLKVDSQSSEIELLRGRTNLSTTNWAKERDDLISKEAYIREEYEVAKQAMQDWELLATEERARREMLEEKAQELEEQLCAQQDAYQRTREEANSQNSTVDGLQRALRELQEERKRELRELVEQSQSQLADLRKQSQAAAATSEELQTRLNSTQKELERALPFEREVKEKNLLIGKLRHEAVILNDHLTKALRFLKRGRPEDSVDRQLITNHFLHFLALDRSDPKKFQVLQLIAALLGWDAEQKEQAGLVRQGSMSAGSLKVPLSPFRRGSSTTSLSTDFSAESPASATTKESLAELWSDFLEREAEAGKSRAPSVAGQGVRSPSVPGVASPGVRQGLESRGKDSSVGGTSGGDVGGPPGG